MTRIFINIVNKLYIYLLKYLAIGNPNFFLLAKNEG